MKSTGIVRRIDELGRIVIPKEMRRTLAIKVGDSMEIFVDGEKMILSKFQELLRLEDMAKALCDSVAEGSGYMVLVCDGSKIICENRRGNSYVGRRISQNVVQAIEERKPIKGGEQNGEDAMVAGENFAVCSFRTIIANGEAPGGVMVCSLEKCETTKLDELSEICALYLSKCLE